jgi:hypothetical protein
MLSMKAWVKIPSGVINRGRRASSFRVSALIKVRNVSKEQISKINLKS